MTDSEEQPQAKPEVARLDDVRKRREPTRSITADSPTASDASVSSDGIGYEVTLDLADTANLPIGLTETANHADTATPESGQPQREDSQDPIAPSHAYKGQPRYPDGSTADAILAAISADHSRAHTDSGPEAPRGSADLRPPDSRPRAERRANDRVLHARMLRANLAAVLHRHGSRNERDPTTASRPERREPQKRRRQMTILVLLAVALLLAVGVAGAPSLRRNPASSQIGTRPPRDPRGQVARGGGRRANKDGRAEGARTRRQQQANARGPYEQAGRRHAHDCFDSERHQRSGRDHTGAGDDQGEQRHHHACATGKDRLLDEHAVELERVGESSRRTANRAAAVSSHGSTSTRKVPKRERTRKPMNR